MSISMFFRSQKKVVRACLAALSFAAAPILFGQSDQEPVPVLRQAPLNPAFVKWQEKQKERAARIALGLPVEPEDRRLGYIPDPFVPPASNAPLTQTEAMVKSGLAVFPTVHDPRQYQVPVIWDLALAQKLSDPRQYLPSGLPPGLFSVRNQGIYGTCWAFSSIAALEYSLVKTGTPTQLSEWHLAYFAYNPINGIPGFTKDSVESGEHETFDQGGSFTQALTIMTRGDLAGGPVPAASSTYGGALPSPSTNSVATVSKALLTETANTSAIKGLVTEYGVVAISMKMEQTNPFYYNRANCAFRYVQSGTTETNHGVNIVGWDDSFSKTKFPAGNQPSTDGAWIVRNSWGDNYYGSDGGYFYMSYDTSIFYIGVYSGFAGADAKTYQYDMLGKTGYSGYNNDTGWISNIFTATANHFIKAVSFHTWGQGATYEIYIRKGVGSNPASGTLAFGPQSGALGSPGYYRIDLNSPVSVSAGEKFAVIVKLVDPSQRTLSLSYAVSWADGATATPGVGWVSYNGSSWSDATTISPTASVCLKAFADTDTVAPVSSVGLNKTSTTMSVGDTETLQATVLPSNATNKNVTWSSSNTGVATVSSSGLVSAVAAGTTTITATSQADTTKFATCSVTVNSVVTVSVSPKTVNLQPNDTHTFTADVTGTTNTAVTWTASGGGITQSGVYTAPSTTGTYTITATSQADSTKFDTATVTVVMPIRTVSIINPPGGLFTGNTHTFNASVTGLSNTAVIWSASAGSITPQGGVFTAPAIAPQRVTITATSVQEPSIRASVQVKISSSAFDYNSKTTPQLLDFANVFGSTAQGDLDKYDFNGDNVIDELDILMLFKEMGW